MELKFKDSHSEWHSGYGAGEGSIDSEEYFCPCGKSVVTYEKDDIPGFRSKSNFCDCKECNGKYVFGRGTATLR